VHDENAWSLDGVSGHAGMFSTAWDLGIFCQASSHGLSGVYADNMWHGHTQMILNNGTYNGVRILQPSTVDLIFHNFNTAFPGNEHGLGFELNQFYWSGAMQSLQTAGHTGYTGTTMVIDRREYTIGVLYEWDMQIFFFIASNTFFIFLSHRVHPSRNWSNINVVREMVGLFVARSLGREV